MSATEPLPFLSGSAWESEVGGTVELIKTLMAKAHSSGPVLVKAVSNDGGVSPIGVVSIQPLVGQLDGNGNVVQHGVIYNVPYLRIQGGKNAVILDPQVGDIGIAVFCDRDISTVKATQAASMPGSRRRNDMSDAVYLHTILSTAPPEQYVQFNADGISVVSPTAITIKAPAIHSEGTWSHTGSITSSGEMTAVGIQLSRHDHGNVRSGSSFTSGPVSHGPPPVLPPVVASDDVSFTPSSG